MTIILDNGHGRDTHGKCSPDGRLLEWRYTRDVANDLRNVLTLEGLDVRMLVPEDRDISLSERCRRANAIYASVGRKGTVLVSIHVNAAGSDGKWHDARGWEAWTSPGRTGADTLANHLYNAASTVLPKFIPELPSKRLIRTDLSDGDCDKEARFTVIMKSACPAVLTENLFQDNRDDVEFLLSPDGRSAIVELHRRGISSYIHSLRK